MMYLITLIITLMMYGILQILANLYFDKVAVPEMDYVEDFADFLIDAELNDLPVLKRACERYLCGELNTVVIDR